MNNTMVGIDSAKEAIQVCTYTNKKVRSNIEMTHHEFLKWLFSNKPTRIIFEACGMSNYWKQIAFEALANKTVRTAFAILTECTEYKAELLPV